MFFACGGSIWGSVSQARAGTKHVLRSSPKASPRAWAPEAERDRKSRGHS